MFIFGFKIFIFKIIMYNKFIKLINKIIFLNSNLIKTLSIIINQKIVFKKKTWITFVSLHFRTDTNHESLLYLKKE